LTIPDILAGGWLPEGVFDATFDDIKERFGCFRVVDRRGTDHRPRMFADLTEYLGELRTWKITGVVYIDGSFISSTTSPGDIDVTFTLAEGFLLRETPLLPTESNLVERAFTRRVYGVDLWVEPTEDALQRRLQSWQKMKPPFKGTKGLLRMAL
jgi:hypothetical protein